MWWHEASKALDTEQLMMCVCVHVSVRPPNTALCCRNGTLWLVWLFSNTPCDRLWSDSRGHPWIYLKHQLPGQQWEYHNVIITHMDTTLTWVRVRTCTTRYHVCRLGELTWPELVSARLSWVAGVLAHSHGFLTHDTILHSQWVEFQTRCVGPASVLVVKSISDSSVEQEWKWIVFKLACVPPQSWFAMSRLHAAMGDCWTQCLHYPWQPWYEEFVWLLRGITTMYTVLKCVGGRTANHRSQHNVHIPTYVYTCICTIVAQYAECIYRPWCNVRLALNKTASGCWSLIGLLLKWQRVHTHNTLTVCPIDSYAVARVCVYVCVRHS